MRFDLTTLRLFLTVAEEKNIARAAEREHIAASAVSKRIADLEEDLDVRLFERHRGGVQLTMAGLTLAAHARSIFDVTDRVRAELSNYARGAKGLVRLSANPSAIPQFLAPLISKFLRAYPDIRLELLEQTSERTVQMVLSRAVDLGIVATGVDFRGLQTIDFRRDTLAMMVPRGHPLARRRRVTFAETLNFDHVGLAEGSSIQATLVEAAEAAGRSLSFKVRVFSFEALRGLVAANIGIACLPVGCIKPYAKTHGLVPVILTDSWAQRQLKVCVIAREDCSMPCRQFISVLGL
jgi:DNA-binding transcriptional LysR family regulator